MIRINLMKSKIDPVTGGDHSTGGRAVGKSEEKQAALKIVIILAFPALLYAYESMNLGELTQKVNVLTGQDRQIHQQIEKLKKNAKNPAQLLTEQKQIEERLLELKKLAKARVRELKALDFIQSRIPERVWLESVDYKERSFVIQGAAMGDEDLNNFLARIEENRSFFSDVILRQSKEQKGNKGTVKAFEISCNLKEGE